MVSYEEAVTLQKELAKKIRVAQNPTIGYASLFGGADVAYVPRKGKAVAAVVVWDLKERQIVTAASAVLDISFPYIPGLLSFRELPVLLEAWRKLKDRPEVWLVDGAGIAHPRRLGLASHFALATKEKCVVGVAKSRLVGAHLPVPHTKGSWVPLVFEGEVVGTVLRTSNGVRPLYVSPGNELSIIQAASVVLRACTHYRLPEPTRLAHALVTKLRGNL
jgi:deoxyribonuclease V